MKKNKPTSDKKNWLKDQLIASLEAKLDKLASQNALELANQLAEKDKEVVSLTNQLDKLALEKDATFQSKLATIEKERDGIKTNWCFKLKKVNCRWLRCAATTKHS